jgi:hypothetical protein
MKTGAIRLWDSFCARHGVLIDSVPLFALSDEQFVRTKEIGRANIRRVLCRSEAMEALIRQAASTLVDNWEKGARQFDGLIYMVGTIEDEAFAPLYIGKAEVAGKTPGVLSANLKGVQTDTSKFARWGDGYAYHIGDLSACVVPGHASSKITKKYLAWAQALFVEFPSHQPVLQKPVYFWAKAWKPENLGVFEELGQTSLANLEYELIGVAGRVFPNLLNYEGRPRW